MKLFLINKYIILIPLLLAGVLTAREITDDLGKTCHTVRIDQDMVEFVMIRGDGVLMYTDRNTVNPLMRLRNRRFVQLLDRDGRMLHIRAFDGINPPRDGWITRFQVYDRSGITAVFWGYGFPVEEEDSSEIVRDIELDQTAWIIKDVSRLYYEPKPSSDYKHEIYFGLRLEIKRQRGDYYFVMIYNSILGEYRPGWVKIEDTGTFEYFVLEYERRKNEYLSDVTNLEKLIGEQEKSKIIFEKEIEELERKRDRLYSDKYRSLQRIDDLRAEHRKRMTEEQKRRSDRIDALRDKISELKELSIELDEKIEELHTNLRRVSDDIEKDRKTVAEYRSIAEDLRSGRIAPDEAAAEMAASKGEIGVVEEIFAREIEDDSEEECEMFRIELESKQHDFEEIRIKMSGPVSREEYDMYYDEYMLIWNEIGELKKELAKCETYARNRHIALYNDALAMRRNYDFDGALDLLLDAVSFKPDFEEAYYQIVLILITLEEDSEIEKYINKVSDPEKKGILLNRRASMVRDRFPDRAIRYYDQMARIYKPDLAFYHAGLVYIERLSDYVNGIRYLKRALEISYEDPRILEALGAAYINIKPGLEGTREENINMAIDYFEKAHRHSEGYRNTDVLSARLSQAYNIQGRASSALKYADLALQITRQPVFGLAHLEKAKALIKMEKINDAEKHLKEALKDLTVKSEAEFWLKEIGK